MTHLLHYSAMTTEDWIESVEGRTDFLNWLAGESPDHVLDRVRVAMIGFAPYDRICTREEARAWLYELAPTGPAANILHAGFVEYWIGTDREHDQFHRWAGSDDILCGGCWS